jgi:hypothetical protein
MAHDKRTILLYGRTNSGKTAQIGVLAEYVKKLTGLNTRLATADKGGTRTVKPYIDEGIIEPVAMGNTDPWIFLNKVTHGYVRDAQGKWILGDNSKVGMFAFESFRSFAEELKSSMAVKAGQGINIGGGANISFKVSGDGETLTVGGGNQAHYMMAQDRITEEVWASLKLDAPFIMWTSSVSKDEDTTAAGKILGPDVIGKALTAETPRWFDLTFRIDVIAAQQGKPERHILYLGNHIDMSAGNAAGLGNTRMPLDAPALKENTIEPANIVKAIELIDSGSALAREVIRKRLNMK